MNQNNPGGNNNTNQPRRTSTTSTSKRTNQLNIIPPTFDRGLGQQRTTGQVMPVSSSKNLSQRSSSGKKPVLKPPRLQKSTSSLPSSISSLSSSSSSNIPPTDITTQIKTDSKNVVNAIKNNRKIEEYVFDFYDKKFHVMSNFLEFEKEDGTYRILFPKGNIEGGDQLYLGKDNGKYYIVIKRMPYNKFVDRKNEELILEKPTVNKLNNTIQEIFPPQSYYSNNNNNNNN